MRWCFICLKIWRASSVDVSARKSAYSSQMRAPPRSSIGWPTSCVALRYSGPSTESRRSAESCAQARLCSSSRRLHVCASRAPVGPRAYSALMELGAPSFINACFGTLGGASAASGGCCANEAVGSGCAAAGGPGKSVGREGISSSSSCTKSTRRARAGAPSFRPRPIFFLGLLPPGRKTSVASESRPAWSPPVCGCAAPDLPESRVGFSFSLSMGRRLSAI